MRGEWKMDNFSCSHRCTSGATLVRGAFGAQTPARPVTCFVSFVSYDRLYPSSVWPCISLPVPIQTRTKDARSFLRKTRPAGLALFLRASNDKACLIQCPKVLRPVASNKSSSIESNTHFDLSSINSRVYKMPVEAHESRHEEYRKR